MALQPGTLEPGHGFVQDDSRSFHHIVDTSMHPELKEPQDEAPVLKKGTDDPFVRKYIPVIEDDCVDSEGDETQDDFCLFCQVDMYSSTNVWYKRMKSYIETSITSIEMATLCKNVVRLFNQHLVPSLPPEFRGRRMHAHTVEKHLKQHSLNHTVILSRRAATLNKLQQIMEKSHLVYLGGDNDSQPQVEFRYLNHYRNVGKELDLTLKALKNLCPTFGGV